MPAVATLLLPVLLALAPADTVEPDYPPRLPGGKTVDSGTSPALLKPTATLRPGVKIAKTPPKIDFLYYPGQDYPGNPWSVWGDSLVVDDIYYSAIGDHKSPEGNAFVFAYDTRAMQLRRVVDLRKLLQRPPGYYTPGKIHSRLDMGSDGRLYFSTHRGSTRIASDPNAHFRGDWIVRYDPAEDRAEVVAENPLPMQCMPCGLLDPDRLIFYAGTADGLNE
ncbi:MAG TPA: hypothetical protein VE890_03430, partial [Thermoguttaceae bacterium]|nr:hypothetical protein [Thermoguttaceae bacterium]